MLGPAGEALNASITTVPSCWTQAPIAWGSGVDNWFRPIATQALCGARSEPPAVSLPRLRTVGLLIIREARPSRATNGPSAGRQRVRSGPKPPPHSGV